VLQRPLTPGVVELAVDERGHLVAEVPAHRGSPRS
jgi:hypothetical protein